MSAVFFFIYVIICVASHSIGGILKKKLTFPLLTGFLVTGIITGPHVLKMLDEDQVSNLDFVFDVCLGFIAFAAGSEMYLPEIKPCIMAIIKITLAQMMAFFSLGIVAVFFFAPQTSFMADMSNSEKIAVALITAVIMSARSPSSAIAIINEMGAKGPFVQTALGVTMVSDVVVIVGFAITLDIAKTVFNDEDLSGQFVSILLGEIFLSLIIGYLLSIVVVKILRINGTKAETLCRQYSPKVHMEYWRPYLRGKGHLFRGLLLLACGFIIFTVADLMHDNIDITLESLLTCMVAGFVVVNKRPSYDPENPVNYRHRLHASLEAVSSVSLVCFFTVVGLGLNISIIPNVIDVALYLFFVRLAIMFIGSYFGGVWAKAPSQHNRLSFLTYVTQAGVALALTEEIKSEFPTWGEDYATTVIAVLVIGQIIGPIVFKQAVKRVGEASGKREGGGQRGAALHTADFTVWWWEDDDATEAGDTAADAEVADTAHSDRGRVTPEIDMTEVDDETEAAETAKIEPGPFVFNLVNGPEVTVQYQGHRSESKDHLIHRSASNVV